LSSLTIWGSNMKFLFKGESTINPSGTSVQAKWILLSKVKIILNTFEDIWNMSVSHNEQNPWQFYYNWRKD